MNTTKISIAVASIFLGMASAAFAADTASTTTDTTATTKEPLSQSTTSVDKNLARDADSKGLNNATTRLETNQDRIEADKTVRTQKRLDKAKYESHPHHVKSSEKLSAGKTKVEKAGHFEKTLSTEKIDHAEKLERTEKIDRPEKVDRIEKVERPEKVGPGR